MFGPPAEPQEKTPAKVTTLTDILGSPPVHEEEGYDDFPDYGVETENGETSAGEDDECEDEQEEDEINQALVNMEVMSYEAVEDALASQKRNILEKDVLGRATHKLDQLKGYKSGVTKKIQEGRINRSGKIY